MKILDVKTTEKFIVQRRDLDERVWEDSFIFTKEVDAVDSRDRSERDCRDFEFRAVRITTATIISEV